MLDSICRSHARFYSELPRLGDSSSALLPKLTISFSLFSSGVDSGQNPDIYTSSLISSIVSLNQAGKAKTVLAEELKTSMEKELAKIWPEDMEKYRQIMAEEGVKNESETGEVAVKAEDGMDVDSG